MRPAPLLISGVYLCSKKKKRCEAANSKQEKKVKTSKQQELTVHPLFISEEKKTTSGTDAKS